MEDTLEEPQIGAVARLLGLPNLMQLSLGLPLARVFFTSRPSPQSAKGCVMALVLSFCTWQVSCITDA